MCYDISFSSDIESIHTLLPNLKIDEQIRINYQMSDHIIGHSYSELPIILDNPHTGEKHLSLFEWGVIPHYTKDPKEFQKMRPNWLNIRSERILGDSKSYWHQIRKNRCLFPVTGTYEHRAIPGWKKKVPYFIKPKAQDLFFLPGLWAYWTKKDSEGTVVDMRKTFAFCTTDANSVMKYIHNDGPNKWRMPLFLPFDLSQRWVEPDLGDAGMQEVLDYSIPSEDLEYTPTYTIRSPKGREDNKRKFEYYEWPNLPALEEMQPDN
ncbi:MAG: SOS response-associated peptidase family protein [Bacteroidota bacterium]